MDELRTSVLIVGGGGSGLSASIFLSDLGVDHLLVERHPGTSHLPKAHYINQRTMEIFRQHGVADDIYAKSAPRRNHGKIRWTTSLGGDGPFDGIDIIALDIMGGGALSKSYDLKGTTHPTHIPQINLEPILRRLAESKPNSQLLFGHELIEHEQDDRDGVSAVVRAADGQLLRVHCDYLLAADAGKTIGPSLGIKMIGDRDRGDYFSVWFTADLEKYIRHDDACMRRFFHPDQPYRVGSLLTFGPDDWGRGSRQWVANFTKAPGAGEVTDEEAVEEALGYLRINVPVTINRVSRWSLEAIVAEQFSSGRIHLIGDAAHKHPPTAGLGLNSGVADAHNIAWKLALVTRGLAGPNLLDSYEQERRPVVMQNAQWSMFANTNRPILMATLGAIGGEATELTHERFAQLLEDSVVGAARRAQLEEVFKIQRVEYAAHDMELGYTYDSVAVVPDGTDPPPRDPMRSEYWPNARPGARVPHVWLQKDGQVLSTHDLVPLGGFALIAGPKGQPWLDAAQQLSTQFGVPISGTRIGPDVEADDPSKSWLELSGITDSGMVLVRPDTHVALRVPMLSADPYSTLQAGLATILARRT